MKHPWWAAGALLVLAMSSLRLLQRAREEAADRHVTILADWPEVRDMAARLGLSDEELLARLKSAGINALLVGASDIQDYLWNDLTFTSRAAAEAVQRQLIDRGIDGVSLKTAGRQFKLISPVIAWERLKDTELGYNPEVLGKARQAGLDLVLRVSNDPWLPRETLFRALQEIGSVNEHLGILLNSDEVPGGMEALPSWTSFIEGQNYAQLLFELRPAKSALKLGYRTPRSTYRAHTIAPNELKDLTPAQQKSRWQRAVQERSCRFLLMHVSPTDSLASFCAGITVLRGDLEREGWRIAWPKPRLSWSMPSFTERQFGPLAAFLLAVIVPVAALRLGMGKTPWASFFKIVFFTLAGACIVAAAAQNPLTRVEIIPFRGIKLAFALALFGSFFSLYSWNQLQAELYQSVRRVDVVGGLFLAVLIGYLMVRMGNAGAGWKAGWEQGVRDRLENLLVARPRFKEFAIGYPLLLLGLHLKTWTKRNFTLGAWALSYRFIIGIGMIGPISMVNTFCHLHSPLYLAFWRSLNGIVLGSLLGALLVSLPIWRGKPSEA